MLTFNTPTLSVHVTLNWKNLPGEYCAGSVGNSVLLAHDGGISSTTLNVVFSVLLRLPAVSFAIIVMLYHPNRGGIVNEVLYLSVASACVRSSILSVPFGYVRFAVTTTDDASVTFAPSSIVAETLNVEPFAGLTLNTEGLSASAVVNNVVFVLFTFPSVSFAKKVTLYLPAVAGIVKVVLYLSVPETLLRFTIVSVLSGCVIFAVTLYT